MTKRKFGKKNIIKLDPLKYNIGLIGESGIGKSTLMKEVCEKLAGEDGYLICNIGKEDGVDAIADAIYDDFPDFQTLSDFVEDVEDNREDYGELKVVIIDTLDELFRITEDEVIRLHNRANPDKKVNSVNGAFGGFGRGEDKVVELILELLWKLKEVGIQFWVVGHTKKKTSTDIITGQEFDQLTSNMMNKYFNAIKTKLHILGVASVDRNIETIKVKQKIGADKSIGKVTGESRIITFRDDNFNIDSKSRFSNIVPEITLEVDEFIEAIKDAIEAENNKHKNKKQSESFNKEVQEKQDAHKAEQEVDESINKKLIEYITTNLPKLSDSVKTEVVTKVKEFEVKTFDDLIDKPTFKIKEMVELMKSYLEK